MLCALVLLAALNSPPESLTTLFTQWREFQRPRVVDGVPDYTPEAIAAQAHALPSWLQKLHALDTRGWTIPQQVDWQLVRAEMNGLDFDHRVLQPWARNPAFYVTVFDEQSDQPAREGPFALGAVELWTYKTPLDAAAAAEIARGLQPIPALLRQARRNLTGNARDLWVFGIKAVKQEREIVAKVAGGHPALKAPAQRALEAIDAYVKWLEEQTPYSQIRRCCTLF